MYPVQLTTKCPNDSLDCMGVKIKNGTEIVPCKICSIKYNPVLPEFGYFKGEKNHRDHFVEPEQAKEPIDLFIVGEAPGKEEDKKGWPFIGKSGDLLREVLSHIDVSYAIGNTTLCRPTTYAGGNRTPTLKEARNCSILVRHLIAYSQPKVLLLLGRIAFSTFMIIDTKLSMSEARRRKFSWRTIPTFVTWHPSYIWRQGGETSVEYSDFVDDIASAVSVAKDAS